MTQLNRQHGVHASTLVLLVVTCLAWPTSAVAVALDKIRLSRIASVTTTEIELGCAMRYLNHTPASSGTELRVHMSLGYDCVNALRPSPNATRRPPGGRMAKLTSISFDTIADHQAIISLHFESPVSFKVMQTSNQYLLTITIDTSKSPAVATTAGVAPKVIASAPPPVIRAPSNRGPSRPVRRAVPKERDLYVLRLTELTSLDDSARTSLDRFESRLPYTYDIVLNGREWHELRLGFFETEAEALSVLDDVRENFPYAWISIATPAEQALAKTQPPPPRDARLQDSASSVQVQAVRASAQHVLLPSDRVTALMADAKSAMVRGDFEQSIRIYTRLLQQPQGSHRAEAREFLGVAREKNGQLALARAEFELYLEEFRDGPDARRVQQRLATLAGPATQPAAEVTVQQAARQTSGWDYNGAASQFYFWGDDRADDDAAAGVSRSELLSQASFSASRRGARFDLLVRGNLGYLHELADKDAERQARVSNLYLDVIDNELALTARLGRQTQHSAGVSGRFDGMHIGYGLWRNLTVNVTAGFPIDSPRFLASPHYYFYGASAGLTNVAEVLDINVFTQRQTIDGIADRQAIGADAQYHNGRFNVFGLVDYDASYDVINNAMLVGNWRFNDRVTLHGRYQGGAGPFLTTRNAIIGQPVNTVAALLETYTEGQVRTLARNRTAEVRSGSAGVSAQLSERWHLNADISYDEHGSTISSGGVAAFPASGPQYVYSGQLLGSSLFRAGDSVVFVLRHLKSRDSDANTGIVDWRLPHGDRLRINPRLAVTRQTRKQNAAGVTQQWIANPMLRVFYNWRRTWRIELEVGSRWSDQELKPALPTSSAANASVESKGYYLQLGYWMNFR
jgi:tetratricopeptide (TPR) repeat protein